MPALGAKRTAALIRSEKRVLVHELQLGLLAKYAIQYCIDRETIGDFGELVLRLLLIVNEPYTCTAEGGAGEPNRRAFFSVEAQAAVLPNERLAHVIQRVYRFFEWCSASPRGAEDWLPLRRDMKRRLG